MIGDDATSDAYKLASHLKDKKIGYMIIIERPTYIIDVNSKIIMMIREIRMSGYISHL